MSPQQLGEKLLVNRHYALIERVYLGFVIVDA
jgi:hypothetical protein